MCVVQVPPSHATVKTTFSATSGKTTLVFDVHPTAFEGNDALDIDRVQENLAAAMGEPAC